MVQYVHDVAKKQILAREKTLTLVALLTMSRPVAKPWDSALAAMKALDT